METTFFLRFSQLCRSIGKSRNAVAQELGIPSGSVSAWKQGVMPRNRTLARIAEYFGVSVNSLLGLEQAEEPRANRVRPEDIKFALFGGEGEITDAMFEEVCRFAQYVKFREAQKQEQ